MALPIVGVAMVIAVIMVFMAVRGSTRRHGRVATGQGGSVPWIDGGSGSDCGSDGGGAGCGGDGGGGGD